MIKRRNRHLLKVLCGTLTLVWLFGKLRSPPRDTFAYSPLRYDPSKVRYVPHELISLTHGKLQHFDSQVDWSRLAYVQYATDLDNICNAVMNFVRMREEFGTSAELVLVYYKGFKYNPKRVPSKQYKPEAKLLQEAEANYGIKLVPVDMISLKSESTTWEASFTKLHVFNLEQYSRIVFFDSDSTILRPLDHLFFLPPSMVALPVLYSKPATRVRGQLPRARTCTERLEEIDQFYETFVRQAQGVDDEFFMEFYNHLPEFHPWDDIELTTALMVIQPSRQVFQQLKSLIKLRGKAEYDMELVNRYLRQAWHSENVYYNENTGEAEPLLTVLGHHDLFMLSGELTLSSLRDHDRYLMDPEDLPYSEFESNDPRAYWMSRECGWNLRSDMERAKVVHFSDHPVPKPWKPQEAADHEGIECTDTLGEDSTSPQCSAITVWNQLYIDFARDRLEYCNLEV